MNEIRTAAVLLLLGVNTVTDLKKKEICLWFTVFTGIGGVAFSGFAESSVCVSLTGLIPGVILMVFSRLFSDKIGTGDGILLMSVGTWIGPLDTFLLIFPAILSAGVFGLICRWRLPACREIPFVPFLFASALCLLCL